MKKVLSVCGAVLSDMVNMWGGVGTTGVDFDSTEINMKECVCLFTGVNTSQPRV